MVEHVALGCHIIGDGKQLFVDNAASLEAVDTCLLNTGRTAAKGHLSGRDDNRRAAPAADNLTDIYLSWCMEEPERLHEDGSLLRQARDFQDALLNGDSSALIGMVKDREVRPEAIQLLNRTLIALETGIQLSYDETGRLIVFNEKERLGVRIAGDGDTALVCRSADGKFVEDKESKHCPALLMVEIASQLQTSFNAWADRPQEGKGSTTLEDLQSKLDPDKIRDMLKESEKYIDFGKKLQELFQGSHEPEELRRLTKELGQMTAKMSPFDLKKALELFNNSQFARDGGLKFTVDNDGSLTIYDKEDDCAIRLQRSGDALFPVLIRNGKIVAHPDDRSMEEWILSFMGGNAERRVKDRMPPPYRPLKPPGE